MRRVVRIALPNAVQAYLRRRQRSVRLRSSSVILGIERDWKLARQSHALKSVLSVLQRMMGPRERCMYCVDSHGTDIEHFRPKGRFPARAYHWANMLLCCSECGRFKGSQFPTAGRHPLLIDPTAEDPWRHLDFDPDTGNLTARFDVGANDWSARGSKTVEVLRLDRREGMAAGYSRTYRRLGDIVRGAFASLASGARTPAELLAVLEPADDHGLLPWCFGCAGQELEPFCSLREQYPHVWAHCVAVVCSS